MSYSGETRTLAEIRFYRAAGEYGFLSNLYPCQVAFEGRTFESSEAAYQFGKPKDPSIAEWIVSAPKPRLVAVAAHALLPYDVKTNWTLMKVGRMNRVVRAKFTQNPELAGKLRATRDAILVEASKTDSFWGAGRNGGGENRLGKVLMNVREELGP